MEGTFVEIPKGGGGGEVERVDGGVEEDCGGELVVERRFVVFLDGVVGVFTCIVESIEILVLWCVCEDGSGGGSGGYGDYSRGWESEVPDVGAEFGGQFGEVGECHELDGVDVVMW